MARPDVMPSAHRSAWNDSGDPVRRPDATECRFCGQPTHGWHAPFHLDGDHENGDPVNLVAACPLCHLPQHLNRPHIAQELTLIWLPELPQAVITLLVREIHVACFAAGINPAALEQPSLRLPAALTASHHAYHAMSDRRTAVVARLGTASPRHLGAAMLELPLDAQRTLPTRLAGLRFLPRGRLFAGGRDIYPDILTDWANGAAPT